MDSRTAAFNILLKIEAQQAYSNIVIDKELASCGLSPRDKSLAVYLVYGVLERKLTLDYALNQLINNGMRGVKTKVKIILRLGAFQILFADKIPQNAAVNESVKLAKKTAPYASGLVNAVLRNLIRNGYNMPSETDKSQFLSVKYSCPKWIVDIWLDYLGEENTKAMLEASLLPPPVYVHVNTLKTTTEALLQSFCNSGYNAEITQGVADSITLYAVPDITRTREYAQGLFHVQDIASQICADELCAVKGETVFDVCSAPGGKAFSIAENMENEGCIKAFDLYATRLELVKSGAERLGIKIIDTAVSDASVYCKEFGFADRVLCDAPCSGLGIIRRKPEIKYKNPKEIDGIEKIQLKILNNSSKYIRNGGTLIYSTCTLNPRENEEVCEKFLSENPEFRKKKDYRRFISDEQNSDGFFIAVFMKEEA